MVDLCFLGESKPYPYFIRKRSFSQGPTGSKSRLLFVNRVSENFPKNANVIHCLGFIALL